MATFKCPDCGKKISLSAEKCPKCGRPVSDADRAAHAPKPLPLWKKLVNLAFVAVLVVGVGRCYWADKQESRALARDMEPRIAEIAGLNADNHGLTKKFGKPSCSVDFSGLGPSVWVDFPSGPMSARQAAAYSRDVCRAVAMAFLAARKPAATVRVRVRTAARGETGARDDLVNVYGVATWQSSNDSITWTAEGR